MSENNRRNEGREEDAEEPSHIVMAGGASALILTKEEAALVRVALVTLRERPGILSREGRALMPALEAKAKATFESFPRE